MMLKIQFYITEINYILKHIQIESKMAYFFNTIFQFFTVFLIK